MSWGFGKLQTSGPKDTLVFLSSPIVTLTIDLPRLNHNFAAQRPLLSFLFETLPDHFSAMGNFALNHAAAGPCSVRPVEALQRGQRSTEIDHEDGVIARRPAT